MPESRTRKPWIAASLSLLLIPGLGHVYIAEMRSGILACSISESLRLLVVFIGAARFPWFFVVSSLGILWRVFVAAHAFVQAKRLRAVPSRRVSRLALLIVIAMPIVVGLARPCYRFRAYRMPSSSMEPTLLAGDFLFVDTWWQHRSTPQRGDVLVFHSLTDGREYIKRCVAVAGDTVEFRAKEFYLNGVIQVEPYVQHSDRGVLSSSQSTRDFMGPIVVPGNRIFMLGDNRDNSHDSRFWGALPVELVRAKALFLYFSVEMLAGRVPKRVRWERLGDEIR